MAENRGSVEIQTYSKEGYPNLLWCADCNAWGPWDVDDMLGLTCSECGSTILCDYCGHPFSGPQDLMEHEAREHGA